MKIIFLDIDGVLNCERTSLMSDDPLVLDDDKLYGLKRIAETCDAKIVLISSWREGWYPDAAHKHLQDKWSDYLDKKMSEYSLEIIDKTDGEFGRRGEGILRWAREHGVQSFVVLDDEPFDYAELHMLPYVVKTDFYGGGLDRRCVDRAIAILSMPL